jgi:hypothetical protein
MKKILLSMLTAAFITIVIPLVIVEICRPQENAASTEQQTQQTKTQTSEK